MQLFRIVWIIVTFFMNINKDNIYKLQKLQNSAAKLILGKKRRESATEALNQLHWLNVEARIIFKALLLVHKVLRGKCSKTISLSYKGFNGRPDDYLKLHTPNFKTVYGTRIFEYYATRLWNELPIALREEDDVVKYKKLLKTLLFEGYNELKKKAFKYKS